jgi:hypothetical protein
MRDLEIRREFQFLLGLILFVHFTFPNNILIKQTTLRAGKASVAILSNISRGGPGLLGGWHAANLLLEVKSMEKRGNRFIPAVSEFMENC